MTDPMKKAVPLAGAGAMSFNGTALAEIDSSRARLPSTYNAAKKAISQCASIDECKDWSDKAAALASYAKQANDETLLNLAQRIRARAVRQAGKLLLDVEEQRGGDRRSDQSRGAPTLITRTQVAVEAGLSRDQAVTAVRVARVPDAAFEEQVEDARPATVSALADQGRKARPAPKTRTPSGSRSARARDQVLANLMRLWNRADDPTRANFLRWITDPPEPGAPQIAEVVERLRSALRAGRIDERDRGFVAGVLKQSKSGRWWPTPTQEYRARRLVDELSADPVIDHGDDGGG